MIKFIFVSLLFISLGFASGTTKLIDFMLEESGTIEVLAKYGIKGGDAKLVENYLSTSLVALGSKKALSKSEFLDVIAKLPVTGSDATLRKDLQILLDKNEIDLNKEDIVKAINSIIYFANRHGKSVIISCAECANESLAKNGFKFTIKEFKNSSTKNLLDNIIPNNPADLQNFISTRMRRLGVGDYSKVTPDVISPEEEKSLALYLGLMENGGPETKKLVNAINKISTKNGTVNLLDKSRPNKFWKVAINDMSSEETNAWTETLNKVSLRVEKENISPEEAFYKILEKKSEGNIALIKKYKSIKLKRCFFR